MVRYNHKLAKRQKIIRDMYDGKPINDREAVSKRNLSIIAEKEGLQWQEETEE